MRDDRLYLIHYLGVDLNTIWDIIERDLPALKWAVATMLDPRG